jgi:hypothetical protein
MEKFGPAGFHPRSLASRQQNDANFHFEVSVKQMESKVLQYSVSLSLE